MHFALFSSACTVFSEVDMTCNNCSVFLEQYGHLRLRQPYGLILEPYFEFHSIVRLVEYYFAGICHSSDFIVAFSSQI